MKKITLSILISLISLVGYSRFSEKLDSETNKVIPGNRSTNHVFWEEPSATDDFYIGAVSSSTDVRVWSTSGTFITPPGNDQCATPYIVPVNATDQCIQVRNASFIGSTISAEGGTNCGTNNSGDIWFQFTAIGTAQIIDLLNFKGTPHPIALTLYKGQCGSLNQLYCSSNNSITATNLTIGTTYLIRVSINTATTDLNVQFDLCIKTPQPPANGSSVNCLINTVNSDFEIPAIANNQLSFQNDNTMLGWRTTATDHIIELWHNYQGVQAYSGSQFIELNAYEASGVYQDYSTPVTTVFNYGFAHRGRQGTDVCGLYAGPPGGPYTLIYTATTGKTAWSYNTGSYTVPTGQTVTRFIFQAISSSSGNPTIGNFLDSINFTANNSIITASPLNLDCMINSTNVLAAGQGTWSAHSSNPSPTVIGNPSSNATNISGFSVSGSYKYDWTTLYCTSTLEITYKNKGNKVPVFTQIQPVCSSANIPLLPTTSKNGISGAWSPALNNTATTTYTFTPTADQCATTVTMTITVNPTSTSTFTQVAAICSGATLAPLPTASIEGVTGIWSPALNNTSTTTYKFTPDANPCAEPATMTITVNPIVTPTFAQIAAICSGDSLSELPTTSNEGVTGTWDPSLDKTNTTTYSFTPTQGQCATPVTTTITVNALPDIASDYSKIICSGNDESVELNAGVLSGSQSDYTYQWYIDEAKLLPSAQAYDLTVNSDGVYTCNIKNKITGCQKIRIITVVYSVAVEIKNVIISDLTENNTITVMASGDAEYSLDNPTGPFQASNVFENVKPGVHTVYVNDKKGCGVVEKTIAVIGAPPFFTPNGDGHNEYWKIQGISVDYLKNTRVDIFDRYGKLIKVLPNAESEGWDGTYNGHPQPSNDYWFVVEVEDGRIVKGHFALKR